MKYSFVGMLVSLLMIFMGIWITKTLVGYYLLLAQVLSLETLNSSSYNQGVNNKTIMMPINLMKSQLK